MNLSSFNKIVENHLSKINEIMIKFAYLILDKQWFVKQAEKSLGNGF